MRGRKIREKDTRTAPQPEEPFERPDPPGTRRVKKGDKMRKTTEREIVCTPDEFLRLIGEDATNIISVHIHQKRCYKPFDQITITITEVNCEG